jgi:ribosome-associated translation inhibitor RaiA
MTKSDALAAHVWLRTSKLERLFDRIVSCHVVFERAGHHHRHGDRSRVTINLALPGGALLVDYPPSDKHAAVSAKAAVDRAFDEEERQLEDWVRRQRADRRDTAFSSRGT